MVYCWCALFIGILLITPESQVWAPLPGWSVTLPHHCLVYHWYTRQGPRVHPLNKVFSHHPRVTSVGAPAWMVSARASLLTVHRWCDCPPPPLPPPGVSVGCRANTQAAYFITPALGAHFTFLILRMAGQPGVYHSAL